MRPLSLYFHITWWGVFIQEKDAAVLKWLHITNGAERIETTVGGLTQNARDGASLSIN